MIVWTTSTNPGDREKCLKPGADHFITRPESYRDLVETIRSIVGRYIPVSAGRKN